MSAAAVSRAENLAYDEVTYRLGVPYTFRIFGRDTHHLEAGISIVMGMIFEKALLTARFRTANVYDQVERIQETDRGMVELKNRIKRSWGLKHYISSAIEEHEVELKELHSTRIARETREGQPIVSRQSWIADKALRTFEQSKLRGRDIVKDSLQDLQERMEVDPESARLIRECEMFWGAAVIFVEHAKVADAPPVRVLKL